MVQFFSASVLDMPSSFCFKKPGMIIFGKWFDFDWMVRGTWSRIIGWKEMRVIWFIMMMMYHDISVKFRLNDENIEFLQM